MPKEVTQETNSRLTQEVEEEEVQKAIWSLHPDKAPGPDGFPISFYREYWQMIKKDLLKMICWVLRKGKLGGYTNSTYLALIPKENRPSTFSRFRLISLCNSAYKIIAKILSSRLKPHLSSLISENQGGFLPNRHITDSTLLVQEAIHSSISRKEKGFVLKLDLANAFDRVRHTFLFAVLHKMGFDPSFINMIKACISNPWISPLINGRPCVAFQSSRGLRQGCPLSPYLFILMAESLSKALDFNRRTGLITGIKFEQGTKNINHSQFADDTLLMGGASITIARHFKKILDQFMEYSGGKINQVKSCIYGWNVANHTIHSIANIIGVSYKLNWSHFTYLGMPVSMAPLKADTWNEIFDKIQRKIQQWGSMWLNPAGRLVLLKSGATAWWKTVLEAKYLNSTRHQLLDTNIPNRDSTKIWKLYKKVIPFMTQNISKVPEGGSSINFSTDRILGQPPIGSNMEVIPAISWLNENGIWCLAQISQWEIHSQAWAGWKLPDYPRELETSIAALKNHLHSKAPTQRSKQDGYRWDPTGTQYTVKAGHQQLCDSTFPQDIWSQWKLVWRAEAPPKVNFFFWLLLKGKILTAENF
eukprot:PITA_16388